MFRRKKILIITIAAITILLIGVVVFIYFAPESFFEPSKDTVINILKNNQSVFEMAPAEIKNLNDNCAYISILTNAGIIALPSSQSIAKIESGDLAVSTIKNGKPFDYVIKNDILYKVLEISGVRGVGQGISDTRFSVFFDCGTGNITFICGFYYSEDNQPFNSHGSDNNGELVPDGIGWKVNLSDGGRYYYYTEKIDDNWFYYYENTQDW